MVKPDRRRPRRRGLSAAIAVLAATGALAAGSQSLAPTSASGAAAEGNECWDSDPAWIWLECDDSTGSGDQTGSEGAGSEGDSSDDDETGADDNGGDSADESGGPTSGVEGFPTEATEYEKEHAEEIKELNEEILRDTAKEREEDPAYDASIAAEKLRWDERADEERRIREEEAREALQDKLDRLRGETSEEREAREGLEARARFAKKRDKILEQYPELALMRDDCDRLWARRQDLLYGNGAPSEEQRLAAHQLHMAVWICEAGLNEKIEQKIKEEEASPRPPAPPATGGRRSARRLAGTSRRAGRGKARARHPVSTRRAG